MTLSADTLVDNFVLFSFLERLLFLFCIFLFGIKSGLLFLSNEVLFILIFSLMFSLLLFILLLVLKLFMLLLIFKTFRLFILLFIDLLFPSCLFIPLSNSSIFFNFC